MKYFFVGLTIISSAFAAMDSDMTSQDKQQTGYSKLSPQERAALQNWVDKNYTTKPKGATGSNVMNGKKQGITLQENLKNGGFIRLSDGTLWEVNPADTPITQGWITPVEMRVETSGDPVFPYKLTNSLTGSVVRVKKAAAAPK